MKLNKLATACLVIFPCAVLSQPFESCPSQAFLMQDANAQLYGIDLVSAKPTVLASQLTFANELNTNSVNAVGFNYKDQYMYGYSKQTPGSVVQLGSNYEMKRLNVQGLPATNFYVGDIQVVGEGNDQRATYYVYHPNFGLYGINLDGDLDASITASLLTNTNT
jgi:hypothetical protein